MEINEYYKSPELFRMVKEHFKEEEKPSHSFDITPNIGHITARNQDGSKTKDISYGDLNPGNVYALRMTTTNVNTGTQETSFALFLDRKMAEQHFHQDKSLYNLAKNREVLTGVMVEGNFDRNLLKQLNVGMEDFNRAAIFSTTQDHYASGQFPQIEKNASTIAERLFNDVQLRNEYVSNMVGRGSTSDLNRYYELSRDQNSSVRHIDAFLVEEHKEALAKAQVQQTANNEEYQYVGMIHSKDHSTPSVAYTNANEYLKAIEEGLKSNPQNLGYETISKDPQLHKQVDDLVYKFYGLSNPNPIESYTEQGRQTISLNEANNHQISIMDLAKEMSFTYRNTNQEGDTIMQKIIQPNENTQQVTQIDLIIKNADNPLTNTVTVDYSSFNDSKSMVQGPNFNPIAQDTDFHLSFTEFVALTKPLNSEEIVKRMENQATNAEKYPLEPKFIKDMQETMKQDYDSLNVIDRSFYHELTDILSYINKNEYPLQRVEHLIEHAELQQQYSKYAEQIFEHFQQSTNNEQKTNITTQDKTETLPLDIDFLKDTFLELKKQESHKQDTSVNGQLYNKILDTLFEFWSKEPEKSIPIAKDLIEYAKQHTDNEFANQIVENYNKTNGIKPENTETKQTVDFTPKSDFHYETSSIKPQTALIAEMMEKYSLDRSTINHFVDFMEAAHPIDRPGTDKTQDTIVFPYVKVDKDFNLESHIYSTMSSTFPAEAFKARSAEDYVGLDKTNAPIGYEHYTEGQKIPLQHHTNTAAIEGGTWMATTAKNPEDVKTVHIYNSAIDAMSEFELYKNKPNLNETAFVSVGTMAHNSQIRGIKELFPDATMYLNFQNNIMGELSTIKSVAVLADNPVNIKTDGRNIDFKLSDGLEFKLNAGMTNYKNFEKMSGINHLEIPNVTILRPRDGVTWNDTLKNFQQAQSRQEQQAERQERHHGMRM